MEVRNDVAGGRKPTRHDARRLGADEDPKTMSQAIAADIRRAIIGGDLAPGQRILQEDLAAQYGTSRIPVREALRILQIDGLIVFVPNSGAWVASLDIAECVEIYMIRERLEPLALGESMTNMPSSAIADLDRLTEATAASKDMEQLLRLDRDFHLFSYSFAAMPELLRMIERYWDNTQHFRRSYMSRLEPRDHWLLYVEHRLLVEAIRNRHRDEAENLLAAHIRKTRLGLQERHAVGGGGHGGRAGRVAQPANAVDRPGRLFDPSKLYPMSTK